MHLVRYALRLISSIFNQFLLKFIIISRVPIEILFQFSRIIPGHLLFFLFFSKSLNSIFCQIPMLTASDVKMFESNGSIYAAVSNLEPISAPNDDSDIFRLETNEIFNFSKIFSHSSKMAVSVDVSRYRNDVIITFTNTRNASDAKPECVTTTPLLFNSKGHVVPLVSITGCNVVKIISKQINDNEIIVVSLNSGLYGGTEAVVYKVKPDGTSSVLQKIPIYHSNDIMFLEARNYLFLVIPNEHQKSDYAIVVEYNVPAQIYKYVS